MRQIEVIALKSFGFIEDLNWTLPENIRPNARYLYGPNIYGCKWRAMRRLEQLSRGRVSRVDTLKASSLRRGQERCRMRANWMRPCVGLCRASDNSWAQLWRHMTLLRFRMGRF